MKKYKVTFNRHEHFSASFSSGNLPVASQRDTLFVEATKVIPVGSSVSFFNRYGLVAYHTDVASIEIVR